MKNQLLRLLTLILLANLGNIAWAQSGAKTEEGYVDPAPTGDVLADEKAHIAAKNQWIKDDPAAYRALGGDPESVLKVVPEKNYDSEISPSTEKKLPAFKATSSFRFVSIEVVPLPKENVSREELKLMESQVNSDFLDENTFLEYGENNSVRIFSANGKDHRATETRKGNNLEWFFENKACESCSKTLNLQLAEESPKHRVVIMMDEDEGSKVAYKISFKSEN